MAQTGTPEAKKAPEWAWRILFGVVLAMLLVGVVRKIRFGSWRSSTASTVEVSRTPVTDRAASKPCGDGWEVLYLKQGMKTLTATRLRDGLEYRLWGDRPYIAYSNKGDHQESYRMPEGIVGWSGQTIPAPIMLEGIQLDSTRVCIEIR